MCLCCIFKRFLSAKMSLFACDTLSMFWKDSVKFTVLNASKSLASLPDSMQKVFHSIFPHFLQSVPEAFQLARMKRCSHKHPPNYLNFNLNGLP